jgi:hypothetical protein
MVLGPWRNDSKKRAIADRLRVEWAHGGRPPGPLGTPRSRQTPGCLNLAPCAKKSAPKPNQG